MRRLELDTFTSPTRTLCPPWGGPLAGEGKRSEASRKVDETAPFILGEALLVVPAKLVRKIVRGDFVDMAELLRDNMEVERRRATGEGEPSQSRRREVPDILSWLQCFSLYAAVVGAHYPEKARELLAYQALLVAEHRRCGGKGWLLYDAAFCQQISNIQEADFSKLNQSLYLTTFVAYGGKGRSCNHCLLSDHSQEECALRPKQVAQYNTRVEERRDLGKATEERGRRKRRGACFAWNDGSCSSPYCRFEHVCSRCFGGHKRVACRSRPLEGERGSVQMRPPERRLN